MGVSAKLDTWKRALGLWVNTAAGWKQVVSGWIFKDSQWYSVPVPYEAPPGTIVAWYGPLEEIPEGWVLCDGTNGTPNLMGRFLRGSDSPGGTGGSTTHSHTLSSSGNHSHNFSQSVTHRHALGGWNASSQFAQSAGAGYYTTYDGGHHHYYTDTSGAHDHGGLAGVTTLPPYQEIAFIMRVKSW